jgi:hypothetical protein
MVNVLWVSRHAPTAEQIADLASKGHQVVALDEGMSLGARSLNDLAEVNDLVEQVISLATEHEAQAVYGVFAAPVQSRLAENVAEQKGYGISCYAAWNVSRSVEGGKPTFSHKAFLWVGYM